MTVIKDADKAWDFVMGKIKLIQDKHRRRMFQALLEGFEDDFRFYPAAKKYHHNTEGGLIIHTAQVLEEALALFEKYKKHMPEITSESVYVCAVLHDLSKCVLYDRLVGAQPQFDYRDGNKFEHDVWTINKANEADLKLTYDEMMGILQAHGGWSKINEPTTKLSTIIHCADMLSSQIVKR